mgnify:CR=1 FL=1
MMQRLEIMAQESEKYVLSLFQRKSVDRVRVDGGDATVSSDRNEEVCGLYNAITSFQFFGKEGISMQLLYSRHRSFTHENMMFSCTTIRLQSSFLHR